MKKWHQDLVEQRRNHYETGGMMTKSERKRNGLWGQGVHLVVDRSWDGKVVAGVEETRLFFRLSQQGLEIEVTAPFYNDPAPVAPSGELDALWEYEVVELFLLGTKGHYLEVELGPHGHYLILLLAGIRQVKKRLCPCRCQVRIIGSRWQASLTVANEQLPLSFSHANAYAIHGQGAGRRYLAAFPVPGERPDFHQPSFFGALPHR